jgi:hypothetical protein
VSGVAYDLKMADLDKKIISMNNAMPTPIACTWTDTRKLRHQSSLRSRRGQHSFAKTPISLQLPVLRQLQLYYASLRISRAPKMNLSRDR